MTAFIENAISGLTSGITGNPFSTPVGSRIEQATDAELASENWALNLEICDLINETEDGPRDAVKAIRKRLTQNAGKNYTVVMYTLTVLETCVKNCGKRLHVLICNKDFIQELVKLIGPKNDPPTAVQEKVLSLIQAWADAFQSQPEMNGVVSVYRDLLSKGIEFPATDLDAMAPIHTPKRTVEHQPVQTRKSQDSSGGSPAATQPKGLTVEQRIKLQSQLDVVQNNMDVFGEMLNELKPGHEQPEEIDLIRELHSTCQKMQKRIVDLINTLSNDELTAELLRINDDLNNLFLRYSRWENNHESFNPDKPKPSPSKPPAPEPDDSLINLNEELPPKVKNIDIKPSPSKSPAQKPGEPSASEGNDEFDMFVHSRNVSYESSKTHGSSYQDNLEPDQVAGGLSSVTLGKSQNTSELEIDEMANWLNETGIKEESVTSSDFEKFLAERAAAAERLPNASQNISDSKPASSKGEKSIFSS